MKLIWLTFVNFCLVEGCLFKYYNREEDNPKVKRYGSDILKNYTRKPSKSNPSCVCGEISPYENTSYIIYAHFNLTNETQRVCPLTVINSNMAITSHRCLMKGDKMNVYDAWTTSKRLVQPNEITLTTRPLISDRENVNFTKEHSKIKKVIYRDHFGYDYQLNGKSQALDSDVAIIIVDFDFNNAITPYQVVPICVPKYQELPTRKLINRKGLYQGVRGQDDLEVKYAIEIYNRFSPILAGKICNEIGKHKLELSEDTLCLRYAATGPTIEGGPLSITATRFVDGGPDRAYLVGIATWVDRSLANANHKFAYFTNINSVVKYIEKQAEKEKSKWCELPPHMDDVWPWEGFNKKQDESLDCDCGVQPSFIKGPQARIIGGSDATQHEFPWLVKLSLLLGVSLSPYYGVHRCGGSIINDRMILTAAHCFITQADINRHRFKTPFYKKMTFANLLEFQYVYLRAHWSDNEFNDPEVIKVYPEKFLLHPGYPEAEDRKRNDFDIALLVLNESISHLLTTKDANGDSKVGQICLPKPGHLDDVIKNNLKATFGGWGRADHAHDKNDNALGETIKYNKTVQGRPYVEYEEVLQKLTNISIFDMRDCASLDRESDDETILHAPTDTRICAGLGTALKMIFLGDSGGPLIVESKKGRFTQIGVASNVNWYTNYTNTNEWPYFRLNSADSTTYYANVEPFLEYIHYYADKYEAKGCRQPK